MNPQAARWNTPPETLTLGAILIVRDEEAALPLLLSDLAQVADEVVVVDTGSQDRTLQICEEWGVRVVQARWAHDFSEARNRAIEHARARYLLSLDADERVSPATQSSLIAFRESPPWDESAAFTLQIETPYNDGQGLSVEAQVRLFPRLPGVRYEGWMQESLTGSLERETVEIIETQWSLQHMGYATPALSRRTYGRMKEICEARLSTDPANPIALTRLARCLVAEGRADEALQRFEQALPLVSAPTERAHLRMGKVSLLRFERNNEAVEQEIARVQQEDPSWAAPDLILGELALEANEWERAKECFQKARAKRLEGAEGWVTTHRMQTLLDWMDGIAHTASSDWEGGIERLQRALTHEPGYVEARLSLGQAYLDHGRYPEAREILEPLGGQAAAVPYFIDVACAIARARILTGAEDAGLACLGPLLDLFAEEFGQASEVGLLDLAEVLLRRGYWAAGQNLVALLEGAPPAS